jgi:hypothetical protein
LELLAVLVLLVMECRVTNHPPDLASVVHVKMGAAIAGRKEMNDVKLGSDRRRWPERP